MVVLLPVEAGDGYTVGELVAEGMQRVVDYDGLAQVAAKTAEVLDVDIWIGLQAVVAVEAVRKEFVVRIEQLDACVGVRLLCQRSGGERTYLRGGVHDDLERLGDQAEELTQVRSKCNEDAHLAACATLIFGACEVFLIIAECPADSHICRVRLLYTRQVRHIR